jgi:IclR family KDG regulon transcriptional repressor
MKRDKSEYVVQSVIRALDIFEALAESDAELGVSELSQRLGIQKAGLVRILHTIEKRGYLERNLETGNYRIGLRAFEMGQVYRHQLGLFQASRPILREIVRRCDESAYIAVLRGHDVVYLDVIQTSKPLRLASRVGSITPAYSTAVGKVQMAFLPPPILAEYLGGLRLSPMTDQTITDMEVLRRELDAIAQQGYASDDQEYEVGVRCIAVPIWDHNRRVIAGISVSGPLSRMTEERIRVELLPLLLESGQEISRRLGYDSSRPGH